MTILHMQTEDVLFLASQVKRTTENSLGQVFQIKGLVQSMEWIGESNDEFRFELDQATRALENQIQLGIVLAARLENEVTEWEQAAATLGGMNAIASVTSGGGAAWADLALIPLAPILTRIHLGPPLHTWADWVRKLYTDLFPEQAIPVIVESNGNAAESKTAPENSPPAGGIAAANPPQVIFPAEQIPSHPGYESYHEIPPKSQGDMYGRAACLPTSISMVTDYYHAKDASHASVSPDEFVAMLDKGDGTSGKGVGFDKLKDDLKQVGYSDVKSFQSDMTGLRDELKNGPVVVNVKVNLSSLPERAINEGNGYNHAIVVKGISADKVLVNDPWTGKEIEIPHDKFERMWKNGDQWMQTIHP